MAWIGRRILYACLVLITRFRGLAGDMAAPSCRVTSTVVASSTVGNGSGTGPAGAGGASPLSAPPPRCLRGLGPQLVRVREEGRQSAGMDEHPASRGDATRAHMDDEARHRLAAAGRLTGGARAQV